MRIILPLAILTLTACNDQGLTTHNAKPEVTIAYPSDGEQVEAGVLLTLMGMADDADHPADQLIATWTSSGTTLCGQIPVAADGISTCSVELSEEQTEITLVVQDPGGASGSDHVTIEVVPTGSPIVALTAPESTGTYYSDRLIEFTGTVSDEEDEPTELSVGIDSSLDTDLSLDIDVVSDGTVSAYGTLSQGEHALTLWAEDSSGKRGSDSVLIQVGPPNSDPTCSIMAPESGSVVELGASVLFEATVDDPDIAENNLEVSWTSDQDGTLGSSTPSSSGAVAFSWTDLSAGTHVVTMEVLDEVGGVCTDLVVLNVGSAPSISITAPSFGDIADQGEDLVFTATVSDTEDDATDLILSWESDQDGVFSTAGATSAGQVQFDVDDLSVGDHTITATVMDTHDMDAVATVDVTINGAPSAPTIALGPDPADTDDGLSATITAGAVDPEGDGISYAYAWYLDGALSSASTTASLASSATSRSDTWTVRITPFDGRVDGDYAEASLNIGNAAPSVSSVMLSPSSAGVGDTITCSWSFNDPDGDSDQSTAAWTIDGAAAGSGTTISSGFGEGDGVSCTVTPSDGTDTGADVSASMTIGNSLPSVSAVTISPANPTASDDLSCSYTFLDADGDADSSTIAWTVRGTAAGTGATLLSGTHARGDGVTCTVTPHDGTDAGTPVADNVVVDNTAPTLSAVSITPTGPATNDSLTASVSASDLDGDSLTASYTWYVDGVAVAASGSTLSGTTWFDKGQGVHAVAVVTDGTDDSAPATSNTATVVNSAPGAPIVSISPTSATEGDSIACVVVLASSDDDTDAVTYSMTWTRSGLAYTGSTTSWTGDTIPASVTTAGESWVCTATPFDGSIDGSTATASLTIGAGNAAPSITSLLLSPSSVYTDDTITATATTYDADGDSVTVSYAWTVDGVSTGTTGSNLSGVSWFDKDQEVAVTATPNDGTDDGIAVTSSTVTVLNTAPTSPSLSISPATPIEAIDDLVCAITSASSDDDGDSLLYTFTWTVDSASFGGASTTTHSGDTVPASATSDGELWACTVTPHDGDDAGSDASASVTIGAGNGLPVITSLTLSPASVYTDDTITASVSTSDADGDTVTVGFDWYVDGVSTGATGSSLSGVSWFDRGQDVHVVATPNDGADDGTPVSSSIITVLNTAPGTPGISIAPSSPVEAVDDLVCTIDSASSEDDGDTVLYTFTWTVDGASYGSATTTTHSGDTVPASATTVGEVWVCTVTPHDGTDAGTAATDTVTVMSEGCPLYVDASVPPGGDGSYGDPLPTVAYGLAYAAASGCEEVVLKAGTYNENVDFNGQVVTVSSESGPEVTIIEPSVGGDVITFDSGETSTSVLEGVTVTGGSSHGIYIVSSDPTILDCIIDDNHGTYGGGVYASDYDGLFQGNTVSDNSATYGGGLYIYESSGTFDGNWLYQNTATYGGGIWLKATATVSNNVLYQNDTHGLWLEVPSSASYDDSNVINNTIVGSTTYGVYLDYYYVTSSSKRYPATDFVNNVVYDSGSWDVYASGSYSQAFDYTTWENNNVYGGSGYNGQSQTGTNGNIAQDPGFAYPGTDDFTLSWGSLCADTGGDVSGYGVTTDYDATARLQGPGTDIGALEYAGPTDDCDGVDDGSQCATACPVYVDPAVAPGGNGDLSDPYSSIRYAQAYRGSCDEIALEPGTYDEPIDFAGEDLYVYSTSGAASTLIAPSVGLNVVTFDSGETSAATLEGVTISGGTTHGVYIVSSDPTILDCIIDQNDGTYGGGVYASDFDGLFQGNTVSDNSATYGGGLYVYESSGIFDGNWFYQNAASYGGGIWLKATATVSNNVLYQNDTHGLWLEVPSSANYDDSNVINNTIVGSTSYGVYLDYYYISSSTKRYPATDFVNNIVYDSGSWDVYASGSYSQAFDYTTWENNNVYGGSGYNGQSQTSTNGNIAQDPGFAHPGTDDFTLSWGSLCVDTGGDVSGYGVGTDHEATARLQGPVTDMGAFEYAGPTDDCDGVDDGSQCATVCPVYVDPTVGLAGNGDVSDPYGSILYAQAYRGSCDEIALEPGTYDTQLDFAGEDLHVYSTSGAPSTIIAPSVGLSVVTFDSGETSAATLEGVTISGGTTHGIYIVSSDATILDCVIDQNDGTYGGGVYASDYNGLFQGNTVSDNSATYGGGLYVYESSGTFDGNWLYQNSASYGGGIWLKATATVSNNVLLQNSTHGLWLEVPSSANYDDSNVVNNTIVGSTSYGVYLDYYYITSSSKRYPATDFVNNIVYDSGSWDIYASGSYSQAFDSTTWEDNDVYGGSGYSYDDQTGTNGNVSQAPNFTDEAADDFTLAWPSAYCIDAGQDTSSYGVSTDIDGITRPLGLAYDLGAYESY